MKTVEIICRNCGADTLLQREAIYEGFTKIGERRSCSNCGFEYTNESEIPYKKKDVEPILFTEADRTVAIEVFDKGESNNLCRHCANYIVNPFTQFCAIHKKEVQATDTCPQFKQAEEKNAEDLF